MAGEIPPLNITVNLETSGVQTGVNQATTSIKNITAAADTAAGKFTGLKTVMLGTFASSALQKGISDFEGFLKDSVKAAEAAQTSVAALGTAMNNAKVNTDANREAIMKSTEAMGNLGFKANDTRDAFTKMITATGSVTESTKLMSVAADYARLKHEDLATAASTLTRGTTGAVRAFREFGIVLDTHLPKNEAIAKAFDQLNQKIGGQAAAYAQTYAGKMQIIGVQTEDLKEKIGNLLLPILTKLESWFIGSLKWLGDHKAAMEAIAVVVGTVLLAVIVNVTAALYAQAAAWVAANLPLIAIIATIGLVVAGFVKLWNASETFRKVVVDALKLVIDAFGYLVGAIGKVVEAATHLPFIGGHFKGIADAVNGAAKEIGGFGDKLDGLANKKIDIKFPNIKDQLAKAGGTASGEPLDITGLVPGGNIDKGAAKAAAAAKKQAEALKKAQDEMTKLQTEYETKLKDRQDKMDTAKAAAKDREIAAYSAFKTKIDDLQTKHDDAMAAAQDKFDQASANAHQTYQDKITQIDADFAAKKADLLTAYNDKITSLEQAAADKAVQLEQAAADKKQSIVQQSIDLLTNAWASATKIDVGSLFTKGSEATLLNTSVVNGIVTSVYGAAKGTAEGLKASLQEKLTEIQKLQQDAGKLAAAGYSQSFIQEVLAQGPQVGDQMAQSLLNAAPDTQASIQSLYGQIQDTSATGLDALATQMNSGAQLATQKLMDQYKQVDVTLQTELAKNAATLQTSIATENATYAKALDAATDAHTKATDAATATLNAALKKENETLTAAQEAANKAFSDGQIAAQNTLTKALTDSAKTYNTAIKAISDSTDQQLTALMAKIDAAAAKIRSLGGTVSGIGSTFTIPTSGGATTTVIPPLGNAFEGAPTGGGYVPSTSSGVDTSTLAGVLAASGLGSAKLTEGSAPSVSTSGSDKYSGITINAPIKVDGSTAPVDIQNKLLSITKYGVGLL
jgi:hypothetical protein